MYEQKLCQEYQMSRTPIREAFRKLQSEGLITIIPERGTFVQRLQTGDIKEIFYLREVLEVAALRLSINHINEEQILELEEKVMGKYKDLTSKKLNDLSKEDKDFIFSVDKAIHRLIVENCYNSRLINFLEILGDQIEIIRSISAVNPGRFKESFLEHKEILLAIKERDLERAEESIIYHLRNVRQSSMIIAENLERHLIKERRDW